jgi:hypothetical protein
MHIRRGFHQAELSSRRLPGPHICDGCFGCLLYPFLEADILGLQLIEGEFKRRIKKDPAVEIEDPTGIFGEGNDTGRNIVENLWTF